MTIGEYEKKFTTLSQFTLFHMANETEKAIRFEDGLQEDISSCVSLLRISDYQALFERALMVKIDLQCAR